MSAFRYQAIEANGGLGSAPPDGGGDDGHGLGAAKPQGGGVAPRK